MINTLCVTLLSSMLLYYRDAIFVDKKDKNVIVQVAGDFYRLVEVILLKPKYFSTGDQYDASQQPL